MRQEQLEAKAQYVPSPSFAYKSKTGATCKAASYKVGRKMRKEDQKSFTWQELKGNDQFHTEKEGREMIQYAFSEED